MKRNGFELLRELFETMEKKEEYLSITKDGFEVRDESSKSVNGETSDVKTLFEWYGFELTKEEIESAKEEFKKMKNGPPPEQLD